MMGSDLMIYGIGTDITKVSRFEKWVKNEEFIKRFFNSQEIMVSGSISAKCEHYAARFAVKEAFSKALGTGISGFNLQELLARRQAITQLCPRDSSLMISSMILSSSC